AIPGAIHEAMRQMRTGRPRPTEVEISPDTLAATAEVTFPPAAAPLPAALDWDQVRRAAALLRDASKPLIWAGGGALMADASRELIALAEALGAPVATTAEGQDMWRLQERWLQEKAPDQAELWRSMQRVLPEDTVLVSGITNMGYWSHFAYRSRQPRTYLTSSYFATLGFSFPVALGAKVA